MCAAMQDAVPGEQPGWHQYVIERATDRIIVGDIGVNFGGPGERQAEIGYSLHPDFWGQGFASEALASLLTHLFDDHRIHRIVAVTGIDNTRSRALLARLGFRHEGTFVESFCEFGTQRWVDDAGYALLAREWGARAG